MLYSPIYNWFDCETNHGRKPLTNIPYQCILCDLKQEPLNAKLGKPGNLVKHLQRHEASSKWLEAYRVFKDSDFNPYAIRFDQSVLNIAKFFINNNLAVVSLRDKYLRRELKIKMGESPE